MREIKKGYNLIIILLVLIVFFCSNIVYSEDIFSLRVPMDDKSRKKDVLTEKARKLVIAKIVDSIFNNIHFMRRERVLYISGVPDDIGEEILSRIKERAKVTDDGIILKPCSALIEEAKQKGAYEYGKEDIAQKAVFTWGYYTSSEDNNHTTADVLSFFSLLRAQYNLLEKGSFHIVLSSSEFDHTEYSTFERKAVYFPLGNYPIFLHVVDEGLEEYTPRRESYEKRKYDGALSSMEAVLLPERKLRLGTEIGNKKINKNL